jgi:hypothetical protein
MQPYSFERCAPETYFLLVQEPLDGHNRRSIALVHLDIDRLGDVEVFCRLGVGKKKELSRRLDSWRSRVRRILNEIGVGGMILVSRL